MKIAERVRDARASLNESAERKPALTNALLVPVFMGAIAWFASTATTLYKESDNAAIRDADNRELRAQLIRCRDREADRTDAWLRHLDEKRRGGE